MKDCHEWTLSLQETVQTISTDLQRFQRLSHPSLHRFEVDPLLWVANLKNARCTDPA
jgi:hypothetical protein